MEHILTFLINWLITHTIDEDKKIGVFHRGEHRPK
jgi:hemerythrin